MSDDGRCKTCGTVTNLPPRPTHAERAKGAIPYDLYEAHLDVAAKIERLAREVCAEWDNINNPDELELGRTMDRLRALVQP
tara:strand:- start:10017 stop:10259 length:243 start_codon:yes stop_codon:yes gene_type:complete